MHVMLHVVELMVIIRSPYTMLLSNVTADRRGGGAELWYLTLFPSQINYVVIWFINKV